ALEEGVRADAPDAVHKSRVATRRLRSLLKTFRPLFDRDRTDALRVELRWLGEALGAPRDAEVLKEEFGDLLSQLGPDAVPPDARDRLLGHLDEQHAQGHAALVEALDGPRMDALRAALVALLVEPPLEGAADRPADEVLPKLRRRAIDEVASLRKWARHEPGELERWHEVRKAAKAVRYATEALVGAMPELEDDAELWEAVTEAFGVVQDTVVAGDLIDAAAGAGGVKDGGVWGLLREAQNERRRAAFRAGRKALRVALDRR
ncbi:MAG: CHAD domain-containing protein, partial [Actinomycetes bacterium]